MRYLLLLICLTLLISCNPQRQETIEKSQSITVPSSENTSLPYLVKGEDGNLYFSWVEKKDSGWFELNYSKLKNETWSEPELIAKGNDWFVNWADYPMIAVDTSGNMIAHYLAKSSAGTYSYDVNIVTKRAGTSSWSEALIPHDDGTPTEHGFTTMLPQSNGTFQVAWLDGRNTGGGDHGGGHGSGGAMTIRTALIDIEGIISSEVELDERVCDCCQTTGVNTENGPVVMYRDRSELEIRDMSIVRYANQTWTEPATVYEDNWNIAGCPVNGPRASSIENTLAVAWYSAANNQPEVKVAFSSDGGATFDKPIMIDNMGPLGRVDIAMIDSQKAVVSWLTSENGKTIIKARFVELSGAFSEPMNISETSESRGSGFPQLEVHDGNVYIAWTVFEEGELSEIEMVRVLVD